MLCNLKIKIIYIRLFNVVESKFKYSDISMVIVIHEYMQNVPLKYCKSADNFIIPNEVNFLQFRYNLPESRDY